MPGAVRALIAGAVLFGAVLASVALIVSRDDHAVEARRTRLQLVGGLLLLPLLADRVLPLPFLRGRWGLAATVALGAGGVALALVSRSLKDSAKR